MPTHGGQGHPISIQIIPSISAHPTPQSGPSAVPRNRVPDPAFGGRLVPIGQNSHGRTHSPDPSVPLHCGAQLASVDGPVAVHP